MRKGPVETPGLFVFHKRFPRFEGRSARDAIQYNVARTDLGTDMAFPDYVQKNIDDFLASIAAIENLYQNDSFSYLAVKSTEGFVLVQGILYLNSQKSKIPEGKFETHRIKAGHFSLPDKSHSRRKFIQQLGTGKIQTPHGEFLFPPNSSNAHGIVYNPFHEVGLQGQRRLGMLSILGAESRMYINALQPHLDWEARAAEAPYDGIQEILTEFQPGVLQGVNRVDIAVLDLAAIDFRSIVEGEIATLIVRTVANAELDKVSVGYRILDQGRVVKRSTLVGSDFEWKNVDDVQLGTATIAVPKAGVVHAFAKYDSIVYHHYYFGDPTSFQNPRRAAYEAFDPKLEVLYEILSKTQGPKRDSREFEAAMPWLFWMLGFAPAYVGGPPRMREAADFTMATPNGHLAVVECTIGILKDDSKLSKLHDRTEAVRHNLDATSIRHVRVLPVIIAAKSRIEITPDLEQAEKLGIHVITREDIDALIERTLFPQNADQIFEQAEHAVAAALAKYK